MESLFLYLIQKIFFGNGELVYLIFALSLHLGEKSDLATKNPYCALTLMGLHIILNILSFNIRNLVIILGNGSH
jgi:hypothetical protein